ncbi:putative lipoprotein [Escherichia coli]|uniref:Putative lipoprotein n=1 Tax=Escherichia coli TaxID=562 RepID=A0A484VVY8_ECOLX|nr:putative lipoprotein [Escherichia coli]
MNTNVFRLLLLGSLFSLSACVQQSEVRQMKHSVSTLNQEMTQLNKETVKITQQKQAECKIQQWGLPSAWSKNTSKTGKPDRYFTYVAGEYYA